MSTPCCSLKLLEPFKSKEHRASLKNLQSSLTSTEEHRVALINLVYDAKFVETTMEQTSDFMQPSAQSDIPKFTTDEVVVLELLASGGYNLIFSLDAINLRKQGDYDANMAGSSSLPAAISSESSQPESEGAHKRGHDRQQTDERLAFANKVNNYKAHHRYVVKFLVPDLKLKKLKSGALDLVREAKMLANMQHPNIITLRGLAEESTGGFAEGATGYFLIIDRLSMTLLEQMKQWKATHRSGKFCFNQLPQVFRKSKVDHRDSKLSGFQERLCALAELASAFVYLHSINVVYRDCKPENIGFVCTVTSSEESSTTSALKLFDFGLAIELNKYQRVTPTSSVYHVGSFGGTHPYIAPEIAKGEPYGLSPDVYTFAIICFEVLTLREPFANLMEHEYTNRVVFGSQRPKLPRTSSATGCWSPELKELLTECWNADSEARPPMDEVQTRLKKIQHSLQLDR